MPILCGMLFLVFDEVAAVVRLRGNVADQLGESLVQYIEGVKADSSGQGWSDLYSSVAGDISHYSKVLVNSKMSDVVNAANRLAGDSVDEGLCARRWSSPCPDGWILVAPGVCQAPLSYTGPCGTMHKLDGLTPTAKANFGTRCEAPWPCLDECVSGHDYTALCPVGWSTVGKGFCQFTNISSARCGSFFKFDTMPFSRKQVFGKVCGSPWACQVACQQNYSATCPVGWSEVEPLMGQCMAPTTYTGPCTMGVNLTMMTPGQKQDFASRCWVTFPCKI